MSVFVYAELTLDCGRYVMGHRKKGLRKHWQGKRKSEGERRRKQLRKERVESTSKTKKEGISNGKEKQRR